MSKFSWALGALTLSATAAAAGGLDRSGQPIGVIFEKGNYGELSFGLINPEVSGKDLAIYGGRSTGGVAGNHKLPGVALKYDLTKQLSVAVIYDQAYGADIEYPELSAGGSLMLGGTQAHVDSAGVTTLLRYKFDDNWSVHGGIRATKASADVTLRGRAYGALSGYNVTFDEDWGVGYVIGGAYERPDIALRVAVTYFSKIKHEFDTVEAMGATAVLASTTEVDTPQAINLDFQTGVAPNTLMFASARWVDWSDFTIDPAFFTPRAGEGLVALEDTTTYTLGVGRKFNDNWSGSVFVTYEPKGDPLVSPLAPTNGYKGIGFAAVYTQDNMKVTLGARYLDLGDAQPETGTPDTARADMSGNHAVAVGLKVGFTF